jgi:hypothetical protein
MNDSTAIATIRAIFSFTYEQYTAIMAWRNANLDEIANQFATTLGITVDQIPIYYWAIGTGLPTVPPVLYLGEDLRVEFWYYTEQTLNLSTASSFLFGTYNLTNTNNIGEFLYFNGTGSFDTLATRYPGLTALQAVAMAGYLDSFIGGIVAGIVEPSCLFRTETVNSKYKLS